MGISSCPNTGETELAAGTPTTVAAHLPARIGQKQDLVRHIEAWEDRRNRAGSKANWQFTTADARIKLRKLYPTIDG